jgi:hypothetical protein
MSEAMQSMRLMKENANFCGEPSIHGGTLGLPDSIPPPSDSPTSEPQAVYNGPLVDPIQSKAESSVENLRHGVRLDCEQNDQNTNSSGNEDRSTSMTPVISSAGSIFEFAGRGIKSIRELTKWRKDP